jgi:hypothetical protein
MTDPTPPTEPEIAEVSRLLAEARHTEPMPEHVAQRLDAVLTELAHGTAGDSDEPASDGEVVAITGRRRRNAAALLVAAAVIVVGGVAVAPHVHVGSSPPSAAAGSRSDSVAQDAGPSTDQRLGDTGAHQKSGAPETKAPAQPGLVHGRVVVRPRRFAATALASRALLQRHLALAPTAHACAGVATGARVVRALYRGAPAALVYRRSADHAQVVDLYVCGDHRPVRSTTLPAR